MYERKTRPEIKQTPVTSAYIMYRIIHMYCAYKLRNKYRVCGEIQNKLHFYNIGTHLLVEVVYIVVFYIPLQQQNILDRLAG